jgi:hypothetical protein
MTGAKQFESLQPRNVATAKETHVKAKHRPVDMVQKCVCVICLKLVLRIKFAYRVTVKKNHRSIYLIPQKMRRYVYEASRRTAQFGRI